MPKQPAQTSLETLTSDQLAQLEQWVLTRPYRAILDQVNKPAPEGFGLDISIKPLQTLHERVTQRLILEKRTGLKVTADAYLALKKADPVPFDEAGIELIMQASFEILQDDEHHTPTRLKSFLGIFDYKHRRQMRETRIQLAKNRDSRAQISLDLRLRQIPRGQRIRYRHDRHRHAL